MLLRLLLRSYQVVVRDLFKKETNISLFVGMRIRLSTGEEGRMEVRESRNWRRRSMRSMGLRYSPREGLDRVAR